MINIEACIEQGLKQLTQVDEPLFEVHCLLQYTANLSRADIMTWPEREISEQLYQTFQNALARRAQGEPMALIMGSKEFWSLDFKVTSDTLIPRPETELLVELAIDNAPHNATVLDVGTGSGCIAVSLCKARADVKMTASDLSEKALQVARDNAQQHQVDIQFIHSDLYQAIPQRFDMIISNPPYIAQDDPHLVNLKFEPQSALVSDDQGLAHIEQLIKQGVRHLHQGGWLMIEHGATQAKDISAFFQKQGFQLIQIHHDLQNLPRVTMGQWPG